MPDSPRDGVLGPCSQCSSEGVISTSCQRPSLHHPVGRFWDKLLTESMDGSDPPSPTLRTPRAALQPLEENPGHAALLQALGGLEEESEDSDDLLSLPEQEPTTPRKRNVLPPLSPRVEMAVMRKLYMAGMTVSPRSRQIRPLPQLGDSFEGGVVWDPKEDLHSEDDEEDVSCDLPPTAYDPSLLDESLVKELDLDELLMPAGAQRPARVKLSPLSRPRPLMAKPLDDVFNRPLGHKHTLITKPIGTEEQ